MKVLRLPVNEKWYHLLMDGTLTFDYRHMTKYWSQRLDGKSYDIVEFYHRFKKDLDPLRFNFQYITSGRIIGYDKDVYIIKFGEKL